MSKITNGGLTQSGTGYFIQLYPYDDSVCQRARQQSVVSK